ncbi:uncharacterized protein LOC121944469 isoform X2 [Plectropomus leopardus]|uniref:uncharacterized protein LOC121944469 isoform X2 n=1 Tax=Plectropomus leopardus TaxID=160734 RepID=UPI001C4D4D15|nr:uncharacterized protein LOC121944469 isoform X2 [Plectropomus leopardus]
MELFKKSQTCGQPITKKKVTHCGAQKKVRWSCLGGHRGMWMSSPYLWEAFPEIHLLTALSILFSGGTFAHFKKCAKHLHLNFMGHKTFFEIQKAYLNPEIKQMKRIEQRGIAANDDHQQPGGSLPHISDPLKKIIAKSRRRERGALLSSYDKRSSILMTSTGTSMQETTAISRLGCVSSSERGKQHRQDDVEDQSESRHRASEVGGLLDRYKTSELKLECEEEELEPWQKHTLLVHFKEESDVGEC